MNTYKKKKKKSTLLSIITIVLWIYKLLEGQNRYTQLHKIYQLQI